MKYRPEIDGLRAVAVLPVILFHAGFETFGGGFVGVDIFFVISGYLITTIIVSELEEGRFSIARFYERRARRILPALFLIVGCSGVLAWMFLLKHDFGEFFQSVVAVATFSSNIYFWLESDYFDTAAELKPLLHTWSLAVEEQYYIIFPLLMIAMWRFGQAVIVGFLIIIFVSSLSYAQWIVFDHPMTAFFLLPTRAWEIMVGAFCAFYLRSATMSARFRVADQVLSAGGLLLIGISVFGYSQTTPTPSLYMLAPTMGTALVILFSNQGTFARTLLSQRLLVGIGLVSYSAYLWHQPIFSFTRHNVLDEPAWFVMMALAVLSLGLAWLSWRFVEMPCRRIRVPKSTVFTTSLLGTGLLLTLGLFVYFNGAFGYGNGRFNRIDQELAILKYDNDNTYLQKQSWKLLRGYADELAYVDGRGSSNNDRDWFNGGLGKLRVLIVGNSHSKDLFNIMFMSSVASQHIELGRFNVEVRDVHAQHTLYDNQNYREADAVMIATRYDERRGDVANLEPMVHRLLDDKKTVILVKNIFEFPTYLGGKWTMFDRAVHEAVKNGIRDGAAISEKSDRLYYSAYNDGQTEAHVFNANAEIDRLKGLHPQIIVLNRMDYICSSSNQVCYSGNANLEKYFPDYGHHTLAGAAFFSERVDEIDWLLPIIEVSKDQNDQANLAVRQ